MLILYRVEKDSRKSHFLRIKEGIKKKVFFLTDYGRNKKKYQSYERHANRTNEDVSKYPKNIRASTKIVALMDSPKPRGRPLWSSLTPRDRVALHSLPATN